MTAGSLVLGLINGLLIGVLAVGIVLIYKANRFLNLAHAQLGALSAQLLAKFVIDWGIPWWVSFVVCVPVGAAVGMTVERLIVRPMRARGASPVAQMLVTIGVTQLLLGVALVSVLGPNQFKLGSRYPLPFTARLHVAGVILNGGDITVLILLPTLIVGLTAFLRFTILGKMIRAAATNPDAAQLSGISPARISAMTWALAGGLSAVAAILQSPSQSTFDVAALGPLLLLLALGAAAFGAFTSIPGALAGGVLIGIAQQLTLAATSNAGESELVVFLVIIGIVLLRGSAIGRVFASSGSVVEDRPPVAVPAAVRDHPLVTLARPALTVSAVALAVLAPFVPILNSEGHRFDLTLIAIYALVAVSLTVAIGWAGQVSLGQFALVGCGAYVAARLSPHGLSMPLMVILGGLVGALVMVVIGLPALRVPGLTLAVTSIGLAVVAPDWLFHQRWFGSPQSLGIDLSAPNLVSGVGHPESQLVVYYVALAVVGVTAVGLLAIRRSQPGRLIIAVRDDERRVATFGVTPATVKTAALSLSGFLAAGAGVLWADAWRTVNPGQFPPELSLAVLAAPVIGGIGSVSGAIAGAIVVYGLTLFAGPATGSWFGPVGQTVGAALLFGGVGLILVLRSYPRGIAGAARDWWQSQLNRLAEQAAASPPPELAGTLIVHDVHRSFGGLAALNGASIEVRPGEIVGLIGPNGAGKTTLMNVISGLLAPASGRVLVSGHDLTGLPPELRYAYGLSRTFQEAGLFPSLTVVEAIQVAMATRHRVGMLASAASAPWARASELGSHDAALALVEEFGLSQWADTLTADLSTGTRRITDLACQVAAGPRMLLLDEPTGGVAQREAEAFGPVLRGVRERLDCSILIVEHDMPLLMGLCDRVYAMDSGRIIAEGTPNAIRNNPAVIASYLGTDERAIARSGATNAVSAPPPEARGQVLTTAEPIVCMDGIDFSYGRLQVLFGVSLQVEPGESLALLGTNGAGKSTLLRVLVGLNPPTAGTVRFDGMDITDLPAYRLASMGLALIPGGRAVFRDMSVRENLEIQCVPLRDSRIDMADRQEQVLATFPSLRAHLSSPAGSLSGGEQQQLALAKAILVQPKVVCIDELSLGLAPIIVQDLLNILRRMRDAGTTIILVEQSVNIAAELCERAVFMEKGEVRFEGRTSELLERDDIARAVFLGGHG